MTAEGPSAPRRPDIEAGASLRARRIDFESETEADDRRDVTMHWLAAAWGADPTTIDSESEEER
jgi:hypothetical protein